MYTLKDTFNDRIISRHRTIEAAVRADIRHGKAVKRANGQNSYIPTDILDIDGNSIRKDSHPDGAEYWRVYERASCNHS